MLKHGYVPVRVEEHRDRLLAIKRGEIVWDEVEVWRKELNRDFDFALSETTLPERPDYQRADAFLIDARHRALAKGLCKNKILEPRPSGRGGDTPLPDGRGSKLSEVKTAQPLSGS